MTKPLVTIHNLETDKIVTREMNDTEYAEYQITVAEYEAKKAEAEAKAEAKSAVQAKLAALGFTVDDLKALGL